MEIVYIGENGIQAVRGYRVWRLFSPVPGAPPELRGIFSDRPWTVNELSIAHCDICGAMEDFSSCTHHPGWSAYMVLDLALDFLADRMAERDSCEDPMDLVVGSCLLAGWVEQGPGGIYRASHAAIEAIIGPRAGAVFVLKTAHAHYRWEVEELIRHPPLFEMEWPWASPAIWVIPDFRSLFSQALDRIYGELIHGPKA